MQVKVELVMLKLVTSGLETVESIFVKEEEEEEEEEEISLPIN